MDGELLLRVIRGTATRDEAQSVAAWRRAAPENEQTYAELETMLRRVGDWYHEIEPQPAPSAREIIDRAATRQSPVLRAKARGASGPPSHWARWIGSAIAAGLLLVAGDAVLRWRAAPTTVARLAVTELTVGDLGETDLRFSDGTLVRLGAGSHVQVDSQAGVREVALQGNAEFTVVHDAAHPFRVRTSSGQAEDLGTHFVVRADSTSMQVAVFDGRVALTGAGGRLELSGGEVGRVPPSGRPELAPRTTERSARDWLRASLVFYGTPMTEVAAVLKSQYHINVRFADSVVARRTVDAWFTHQPTASEALTLLCRAVNARCQASDSLVVISSRAP